MHNANSGFRTVFIVPILSNRADVDVMALYKPTKCQKFLEGRNGTYSARGSCTELTVSNQCQFVRVRFEHETTEVAEKGKGLRRHLTDGSETKGSG